MAMASEPNSSFAPSVDSDPNPTSDTNPAGFCIIEELETVQNFATMELQEIQDNIRSRRNKIFLHIEEIRRLRIQQRIKRAELGAVNEDQENELPSFPSFIPFLPPLSSDNLKQYYAVCYSIVAGFILFGGLITPSLELKLGIGGTSYEDFIVNMHLPLQLSQVDPIVASFSGGAVGVISALMVIEINNVKQQEHKRCKYCLGTGVIMSYVSLDGTPVPGSISPEKRPGAITPSSKWRWQRVNGNEGLVSLTKTSSTLKVLQHFVGILSLVGQRQHPSQLSGNRR
ncbi:protein ORANGE-GREEN, chloroplastic [Pyrus x bretschneideri]|uniref:protein ORANGE-GREEN, chloroplastic n=1 Tax=Pyrus x bretschneideri TaxID=225117 RepID=UPI0005116E18|nr:protein ORANGE-GREEN, chloroplastic [Pyrus x bretschneideri]XP_048421115.1 protein ORANGE-GREEN, chloroplastic [Pyrus x bretschneideri]XP_048421116.1 protein ORANGE-GREEN, chloroplastic [Pyrus x bretschneideri]XP_048421117.1 protein ORANGE-GREEN, chloroplastic [Pyrus x bretschneideri]